MAQTKTSLCNLALSTFGDTRNQLTDVDTDNTVISRQCLLHYEQTLHELVRMHTWNCAKGRAVLQPFPTSIVVSGAGDSVDLSSAAYKWTASSSGTSEYYLELLAGGDPSLTESDSVEVSSVELVNGTAGSLSAGEWSFADNDTLGYETVYIRLSGSGDPNLETSITQEFDINGEWDYVSTDSNGYHYYQSDSSGTYTAEISSSEWVIENAANNDFYSSTDTTLTTPPKSGWSVEASGISPAPIITYKYPWPAWSYRHLLPTDCVRPLELTESSSTTQFYRPNIDWVPEGRYIYNNHESPMLIYEKEPTPANMDALFARAFYTLLATKLAMPIAGIDPSNLINQFESLVLPEARRVNGFEGSEPVVVDSEWMDASVGGDANYRPFSNTSYGTFP